ncbi:hypothetical protein WJX72_001538 [[Myrmecia] bisecta]|uniref:TraB domain-containing protein n=1 Tax=[Myrmecia] bisecta TaxID=41462 RepID=A0AAW1Q5Z2_9CHLO
MAGLELATQPDVLSKCTILKYKSTDNPLGPTQTFYILGTAHISSKSCSDVQKLIRQVRPEVVVLELCRERTGILQPAEPEKHEKLQLRELVASWRAGNTTLFQIVYAFMLRQLGDAVEVQPGEEFRVAVLEALEVGAKLQFGDRSLSITIARVWAALSAWQKVKLVWYLCVTGIMVPDAKELNAFMDSMKDTDVVTEAIKELGQEFPQLLQPLIHERDQHIVWQLRLAATKATKIVVVVGAGHLPGIRANWDNPDIDYEEITRMPEKKTSIITWRRVALVSVSGAAIAALCFRLRR